MIKRLMLALVAVLTLIVAACHSSDPIFTAAGDRVHVVSTTGSVERQIHLFVPAQYMTNIDFRDAMRWATQQADRSPYINMTLHAPETAPTSCPDYHCITVYRAPMNGAVTSMGWDSNGHMYGKYASVGFDSGSWERNSLLNAGCHEIAGHALGLAHSSDGTMGPCQTSLTEHDLNLINEAHAHQDGNSYPGNSANLATTELEGGKLTFRTHSHPKGYYEGNVGEAIKAYADR
jgi:hypothetical protein